MFSGKFDIEEEKEESVDYNDSEEKEFTSYLIKGLSNGYYWKVYVSDTDESEDYIVGEGYIVIYDKSDEEIIKVWWNDWFINFYFKLYDWKVKSNISDIPYGEQSLIVYKDFDWLWFLII